MNTTIQVLAYIASVTILIAYYRLARNRPQSRHRFNQANAFGAIPILASEVVVGAWPALILTASFGGIAAAALWRDRG